MIKVSENIRTIETKGCDILVGTPGRVLDFIVRRVLLVDSLKYLVLDEADKLLDPDFVEIIASIVQAEEFPPVCF